MRSWLKRALFAALGKTPEAVVVAAEPLAEVMRELTPEREQIVIPVLAGEAAGEAWLRLRRACRGRRVALAAIPLSERGLLGGALLAWPNKVLGFQGNGDRHHVRATEPIASALFLMGVPLDRIFLRPWQRDLSVLPQAWREMEGRPWRAGKPRVAVLSPYCTYPLSHGGAVRLHNILREAAREFDIALFAFEDGQTEADFERTLEFCSRLYVAAKPYYRLPRWCTLAPPEACEFYTPALAAQLRAELARMDIALLQTEYTQMARYGGEILTEHDVTFDLFQQLHERAPTLRTWWDLFRWRRFERRALRRFPAVVAMSEKDAALIQHSNVTVIGNGVDLARFAPTPESGPARLLFIGSFRHFPNVGAYRWLVEEVWPLLAMHDLLATVVAGAEPHLYWPNPPADARIDLRGFVADVRPLYAEATIVVIPTRVSAGTNLKALEAMATQRAIVSTTCGVAGLGLEHGRSVWIADSAPEFAAGIMRLLGDEELRAALARNAREIAVARYGWPALAELQVELWRSLLAR